MTHNIHLCLIAQNVNKSFIFNRYLPRHQQTGDASRKKNKTFQQLSDHRIIGTSVQNLFPFALRSLPPAPMLCQQTISSHLLPPTNSFTHSLISNAVHQPSEVSGRFRAAPMPPNKPRNTKCNKCEPCSLEFFFL